MSNAQIRKIINVIYYVIVGFLIARVVMSWVPALQGNVLGSIVYGATEPVLAPIRKLLPAMGNFDFTIILLWFGLSWVRNQLMRKFV